MDIRSFPKPQAHQPTSNQQKGTSISGMIPTATKEETKNQQPQEYTEPKEHTVIEEYLTFLKSKGIEEDMLYKALDQLLSTGQFLWQFYLLDKIPVVFKVRPSFVNSMVIQEIEKSNPRTVSMFQDLININNLAGSLFKYNNTTLDATDASSFAKAKDFTSKLPFVIAQKLVQELTIFDRLIAVATSDYALENFTKLHSEEREQN
jgi:hypothetical protein